MAQIRCTNCHETKDTTEFHVSRIRLSGKDGLCKVCRAIHNRRTHVARSAKDRAAAFEAYGNKCACCGESELAFLAIDHVDDGGNTHRRDVVRSKSSPNFVAWLRRNGFPAGFQILCFNCNQAKSALGICPHQTKG